MNTGHSGQLTAEPGGALVIHRGFSDRSPPSRDHPRMLPNKAIAWLAFLSQCPEAVPPNSDFLPHSTGATGSSGLGLIPFHQSCEGCPDMETL